ncbi:MAG: hypothetical protein Q8M16_09680 [Pirellulaceae bacterium]|nr:hypothetical protein [Pirellulaceae bacterium]
METSRYLFVWDVVWPMHQFIVEIRNLMKAEAVGRAKSVAANSGWLPRFFAFLGFFCNLMVATQPVSAQLVSGYGSLPGFSENSSSKRIGDSHRFAKAQSQLTGLVRPEDEIWLISTRQLCQRSSVAAGSTFHQAEVARWAEGTWSSSSSEQLLQNINADQSRLNLLFIHGNRTDLQWANLRGVETYEKIVSTPETQACAVEPASPIRWIIWAWNSDPIPGPRMDLTVKKQRAIDQGTYLAEFFHGVEQPSMSVFAYSLGAQVLATSLGVRTAASLNNLESEESTDLVCRRPQLDVVMVAAAVPTCWFNTADAGICLPACVNRLTLINNPEDRALKVYQRITHQHPIGLHDKRIRTGVHSETYLVDGNSLDNHYLSRYMEHVGTRLLIRQGLLPQTKK